MSLKLDIEVTGELTALSKKTDTPSSLTVKVTPEQALNPVGVMVVTIETGQSDAMFTDNSRISQIEIPDFGGETDSIRKPGSSIWVIAGQTLNLSPDEPLIFHMETIRADAPPGKTKITIQLYDPDIGFDIDKDTQIVASGNGDVIKSKTGLHLGHLELNTPVILENRLSQTQLSWTFAGPSGCEAEVCIFPDSLPKLVSERLHYPVDDSQGGEVSSLDLSSFSATFGELFSHVDVMASFATNWVRVVMTLFPPVGDDHVVHQPLSCETAFFYLKTDVWSRLPLEFLGCPTAIFTQKIELAVAANNPAKVYERSRLWGIFLPRKKTGKVKIMVSDTSGSRWKTTGKTLDNRTSMMSSVLLTHAADGHSPHIWFVGENLLSDRTFQTHTAAASTQAAMLSLDPVVREADSVKLSGTPPPQCWGHRLLPLGDDEFLMIGGLDKLGNPLQNPWHARADVDAMEIAMKPVGAEFDSNVWTTSPPFAPGLCFGAVIMPAGATKDSNSRTVFVLGGTNQLTGKGSTVQNLWRGVIPDSTDSKFSIHWYTEPYFKIGTGNETVIAADLSVYDAKRHLLCVLATVIDQNQGQEYNIRYLVKTTVSGSNREKMNETPMQFSDGIGWRSIREPHLLRSVVVNTGASDAPAVLAWPIIDSQEYLGDAVDCNDIHRRPANLYPELNRYA